MAKGEIIGSIEVFYLCPRCQAISGGLHEYCKFCKEYLYVSEELNKTLAAVRELPGVLELLNNVKQYKPGPTKPSISISRIRHYEKSILKLLNDHGIIYSPEFLYTVRDMLAEIGVEVTNG